MLGENERLLKRGAGRPPLPEGSSGWHESEKSKTNAEILLASSIASVAVAFVFTPKFRWRLAICTELVSRGVPEALDGMAR